MPELDATVVLDLVECVRERSSGVRTELQAPWQFEGGLGASGLPGNRRAAIDREERKDVDARAQVGRHRGDGRARPEPRLELGGGAMEPGDLGELGELDARDVDPIELGGALRRRERHELRAAAPATAATAPPDAPRRRGAHRLHVGRHRVDRPDLGREVEPVQDEGAALGVRHHAERQHAHRVQQARFAVDDALGRHEVGDPAGVRDASRDGIGRRLGTARFLPPALVAGGHGLRCAELRLRTGGIEERALEHVLRSESGDEERWRIRPPSREHGHPVGIVALEVDEPELDAQQVTGPQHRHAGQRLGRRPDADAADDRADAGELELEVADRQRDRRRRREDAAHRREHARIELGHGSPSRSARPPGRDTTNFAAALVGLRCRPPW